MADLFRLLSAGGRFSNKRPLLHDDGSSKQESSKTQELTAASELDFFATATHEPVKRVKVENEHDEPEEQGDDGIDNLDEEAEVELNTEEQIAVFRKRYRIKVTGSEIVKPISSFEDLANQYSLHSFLVSSLEAAGYKKPTPVQLQAIPTLLSRRELLAIAPTGSGKTLAYVLPILQHLKGPRKQGVRALIVVPTRELAQQIHREFKKLSGDRGFRLCVLTKAMAGAVTSAPELKQKFDVLVVTPLRLVGLIKENAMDLSTVETLVLDEGDRLLEMGFLDQLDEILAACSHKSLVRCLFSATLPPAIEELARTVMHDPIRLTIGQRNTTTTTVKQRLMFVGNEQGKLLAVRQLVQQGLKPPVLIFVQSIERAKELFHELVYDGINVDVIHSERTQTQRDAIIANFRSGRIWFLIATELLSRGMDFKGISTVINFDFPQSTTSYIHRIGRAGRAGRSGEAVTFFTKDDAIYLRSTAHVMKESGCEVPDWMLALKKPNKRDRKRLARTPVDRETISTVPEYDKRKHAKKRNAIENSRKRKREAEANATNNATNS